MNMYPLNEINRKLDSLKADMDWAIDHIQKTWDTTVYLVGFAKRVEPFVDQLPSLYATITQLQLENEQLRNRQVNTAVPHGTISEINERANPIIVHINHGAAWYIVYMEKTLFEQAHLKVGQVVTVEGGLGNHKPRGYRHPRTIINATSIKIIDNMVDENLED